MNTTSSSVIKPRLTKVDGKLTLTDGHLSLFGDFSQMKNRLQTNRLNGELLVKASKLKDVASIKTAVDATAGLGEDSLLLAAAGFKVTLFEYNPIIADLLEDAMTRAKEDPDLAPIIERMTLIKEDSLRGLNSLSISPDIIYLDPMFPKRSKSGLIKKKFQLLQQIETPCQNEEKLFEVALEAKPKKIIVKRPLKGPFLSNKKPDYSLYGKSIRYDCFYLFS